MWGTAVCCHHVAVSKWPCDRCLTDCMQLSPSWQANRFVANQEIPRISRKPKVHYRIHKCPHLSLCWASSIQSMPPHPTSWRSTLILSSHLRWVSKVVCCPQVFPPKPVYTSPHSNECYMPGPYHSSRFDCLNNVRWAVQLVSIFVGRTGFWEEVCCIYGLRFVFVHVISFGESFFSHFTISQV
jgi:hypothetical protein